jgi:hypothetical protein
MEMKKKLQNDWAELEDEYNELNTMVDELEEFTDYEDVNIKTTTVYLLMKRRMEEIAKQQSFYQKLGIFN